MTGQEFAYFENSTVALTVEMPAYLLNNIRLALKRLIDPNRCSCSIEDYPIQQLSLLHSHIQKSFEENEGLNKYIEREIAEKNGRDFSV